MGHEQLDVVDERRPGALGGGKAGDFLALFPAEQLIDRHVERLAHDVVERDVDGALRSQQHAPALEILAAVELLPDPADLHGIFADEKLAEVFERADHGQFAPTQAGLAQPGDAFVGFDLDDQLVAVADPDRQGFDRSDAHREMILSCGLFDPTHRSAPLSQSGNRAENRFAGVWAAQLRRPNP